MALLAGSGAPLGAQEVQGPVVPQVRASDDVPAVVPDPLDRAASLAADTHPAVRSAGAEREALRSDYRGARWLRYPSVSVEALAVTDGTRIGTDNPWALNAVLEQPIWAGGRVGGQIDYARANWLAGIDRARAAAQDIALDTIGAYYDLVLAQKREQVLAASVADHGELLGAISRRVEREVSPQADLTLGQSRAAQVDLDLTSAVELGRTASNRLRELTGGVVVDAVMPPVDDNLTALLPPEGVAVMEALDCSPVLAALRNQEDAARAQRKIARGQLFPQLVGQLSQNEITGARAALVLRAQTGNGLSQLSAVDSATARIDRAAADRADAERALREQLRADYILLTSSLGRLAAGNLAADASADITQSYQRQFIAGRRSWLDVMNAVREAANAGLGTVNAQVGAAAAAARISLLTCRWQPGAAQVAVGSTQ